LGDFFVCLKLDYIRYNTIMKTNKAEQQTLAEEYIERSSRIMLLDPQVVTERGLKEGILVINPNSQRVDFAPIGEQPAKP